MNTDIAIIEEDNVTTVESTERVIEPEYRDDNGFNKELMNLIFAMHYICDDEEVSNKDNARTLVMKYMRHIDCNNCAYTLPIHKLKTLYAMIDNNAIQRDKDGNWVNTYAHYFDRKLNAVLVIDPLLFDGERYIIQDIYIPYGSDAATKMNRIVKRNQLRASPIV